MGESYIDIDRTVALTGHIVVKKADYESAQARIAELEVDIERYDDINTRDEATIDGQFVRIAELEQELKNKTEALDDYMKHIGAGKNVVAIEARVDELTSGFIAAIHALQSYAFGNQSPELAKEVVEKLKEILEHSPIEEEVMKKKFYVGKKCLNCHQMIQVKTLSESYEHIFVNNRLMHVHRLYHKCGALIASEEVE